MDFIRARVVFCPVCQSDKITVGEVTRNYGEVLTLDATCNAIALTLRQDTIRPSHTGGDPLI